MDAMRITFLADSLRRGGSERQLHLLLRELVQRGHRGLSLVLRRPGDGFEASSPPGVRVDVPGSPLGRTAFFRHIRTHLRRFSPHIVHTWEKSAAFAAAVARVLSPRRFRLVDGTSRFSRPLPPLSGTRWVFRFNHAVADVVVGNSRAALKVHGHVPGPRHLLIPNGLDLSRFSPALPRSEEGARPVRVAMAANFTPAKDQALLVRAGVALLEKGLSLEFLFFGQGPLLGRVKESVPEPWRGSFAFPGSVVDVEERLAACDLGVLLNPPGHGEGMSNAVMETMASGLPVICTDAGGNPELVDDGVEGFLVPCSDTGALVAALERLARSPDLRAEMGAAGRRRAERDFSASRMAEAYAALYTALAER